MDSYPILVTYKPLHCVLYILSYILLYLLWCPLEPTDPHPLVTHWDLLYPHSVFSLTWLHISSWQTPMSLWRSVSLQAPCQFHLSIKMLWDDDWLSCVQGACSVREAEIVQTSVSGEFSWGLFLSHGHTEVVCMLITSLICVFVQSYKTKTKNYFVNIQSYLSQ